MPLTLPQSFSDLHVYKNAILKRRWTVLLCVALTVVFTAVQLSGRVPLYTTTARILVGYQPAKPFDIQEVLERNPFQQGGPPRDVSSMTEFSLLTSRALAERVIRKLRLDETPDVFSSGYTLRYRIARLVPTDVRHRIKSLFHFGEAEKPPAPEAEGRADDSSRKIAPLINGYLASLSIKPTMGNLIEVRLSGKDPKAIARILSTHLEELVKMDLELKYAPSEEAQKWIEEKLEEAKRQLDTAQVELLEYMDEHKLELMTTADTVNPLQKDMEKYSAALSEVRMNKTKIKKLVELAKRVSADPSSFLTFLPEIPPDAFPTVRALMENLVRLKMEYDNQSSQYGPEHPKMVQLMSLIRSVQKDISTEASKLVKSFELQYAYYEGLEKEILQNLEPINEQIKALTHAWPVFESLRNQRSTYQAVYNQILEKLNTIRLLGTMPNEQLVSSIKIIDKPVVPNVPMGTNKMKKISYAAVMGLLLGVALSLFFEFLDNVIRTPHDIQRFFKVAFLGPFPTLRTERARPASGLSETSITLSDPSSVEAEAVRNIRTNIIFSFADRKNHALVFTSPLPSEGKSTVACALAVSMAQLGKKTLLVEADLRRPTIHRILGIENKGGLSDVLIGELQLDAAVRPSEIPHLDVMPCGTIPPSPSELLGSDVMAETLAELKRRYEILVFDSPPIHSVMDALVLSRHADGVVLVVRAGTSTVPATRQAVQKLEALQTRLLGIILNDFSTVSEYYPSYHYYGPHPDTHEEESVSLPV